MGDKWKKVNFQKACNSFPMLHGQLMYNTTRLVISSAERQNIHKRLAHYPKAISKFIWEWGTPTGFRESLNGVFSLHEIVKWVFSLREIVKWDSCMIRELHFFFAWNCEFRFFFEWNRESGSLRYSWNSHSYSFPCSWKSSKINRRYFFLLLQLENTFEY